MEIYWSECCLIVFIIIVGERFFECDICYKRFIFKYSMMRYRKKYMDFGFFSFSDDEDNNNNQDEFGVSKLVIYYRLILFRMFIVILVIFVIVMMDFFNVIVSGDIND